MFRNWNSIQTSSCSSCCLHFCTRQHWTVHTWLCARICVRSDFSRWGFRWRRRLRWALSAYLIVPEFSIAAALVLGAIVAPPDAVSASAIGRKLGLPRRIMTLLGGESLLNDATALTAYKVALAAAVGTGATLIGGFETFLVAAVGGTVIGLAVGFVISKVRGKLSGSGDGERNRIGGAVLHLHWLRKRSTRRASIAVVVAGLFLGQRSTRASYATRLQDTAVWRAVDLILESFVFLLIGLQLPSVVNGLQGYSTSIVVWASVAVLVTVVVVRIAWVFPFTYVPRWLSPRIRAREPEISARAVFVVSWAGMRGVVSLAAAFAIPLTVNSGEDFPGRSLILFLTFVVVVGTLFAARPDVAVGDPCPRPCRGTKSSPTLAPRRPLRTRLHGPLRRGWTNWSEPTPTTSLRSAIVPRTSCEAGTPTARTRRGSDWDAATRIWGRARRTPSARCASR